MLNELHFNESEIRFANDNFISTASSELGMNEKKNREEGEE